MEVAEVTSARLTDELVELWRGELVERELAPSTVEKYVREGRRLRAWLGDDEAVDRRRVLAYKSWLVSCYAPSTVNAALAAVNDLLAFCGGRGLSGLRLRSLRVQPVSYRSMEHDLTLDEYRQMVCTAYELGDERMALVVQALCSCGLRVSELGCVTVAAVEMREARVNNKGKVRRVILSDVLCETLRAYALRRGIREGPVFVTRSGGPISRTTIWRGMKRLAGVAGVLPSKAYPHNLRHLFALVHYGRCRDLNVLSEMLGHARVETTRIYVATTGQERSAQVNSLGLFVGSEGLGFLKGGPQRNRRSVAGERRRNESSRSKRALGRARMAGSACSARRPSGRWPRAERGRGR